MRKQTKIAAIVSAAALLAIGASMASFAATSWVEEDGGWRYYDKDGYAVTEAWRQSGGQWFWLDEDGYMATNRLLESADDNGNTYYVGPTGARVTNQWVAITDEDANYYWYDEENDAGYNWYYFQASGKAYKTTGKTSFKNIDGKYYAFDGDGRMLYGWVNDNSERVTGDGAYMQGIYYCGTIEDGARVTNDWRKLYVGNDGPAFNSDAQDEEYWFYFGANGKKIQGPNDDGTKEYRTKKIDGKNYVFDEWGIMQTTWYGSESEASVVVGFYGDEEDGSRHKGWFYKVPSETMDQSAYNDDSKKWFYANNDGTLVYGRIKTINGKKYGFKYNGEMMSGLWALCVNGSDNTLAAYQKDGKPVEGANIDTEYKANNLTATVNAFEANLESAGYSKPDVEVYYFGGSEDGAMKVGNQTLSVDGVTYQFTFGRSGDVYGQGVKGLDKKVFYEYGKRVKADADYRYQAIEIIKVPVLDEDGNPKVDAQGNPIYKTRYSVEPVTLSTNYVADSDGHDYYLVNTSGGQMTGTKYTDAEGRIYELDKTTHKITKCYWK